jgi:hypothetical protein
MFGMEDEKKPVLPLSQSRYGDMACETLYVYKHVWHERIADSDAAARGIEIHEAQRTSTTSSKLGIRRT